MQELTQILRDATAAIGPEYFLLPVHGADPVYRERVYCYELYHQMRMRWPDGLYRLNGEVDKNAHPYFQEGGQPKPDFIVHRPGTGENYAVIEVKSCRAVLKDIRKDLGTLSVFRNQAGYRRAIYLIYGDDMVRTAARIQRCAAEIQEIAPFELWLHSAAGTPAAN